MATESAHKSSMTVELYAGVNPKTGGAVIRSFSLGSVARGADKDKVMNVVNALTPVLNHSLVHVKRTEVTILEN